MDDNRACPHRIVKSVDTRGEIYPSERWVCEWCGQKFIPATRVSADKFIRENNEADARSEAIMSEMNALEVNHGR